MAVKQNLEPNFLLLGAFYSLEQCGLLLHDAAALTEERRYPTAVAIALLAREELGRHKILLGFWQEAHSGTVITRDRVNSACVDHATKQRHSGGSLFYRLQPGDQVNRLVQSGQNVELDAAQRTAAREQLDLIDDRKRKGQPDARHKTRMRAIYVDIAPDEDRWLRPSDLNPQDCADEVSAAIDDYVRACGRVDAEEADKLHGDSQLVDALGALPHRPTLPVRPMISIQAALPSSRQPS
jgi:AbiV family abortive infection protein